MGWRNGLGDWILLYRDSQDLQSGSQPLATPIPGYSMPSSDPHGLFVASNVVHMKTNNF